MKPHVKFFGVIVSNEFSYGITGRAWTLAIRPSGRCASDDRSEKTMVENERLERKERKEGEKNEKGRERKRENIQH